MSSLYTRLILLANTKTQELSAMCYFQVLNIKLDTIKKILSFIIYKKPIQSVFK